MKRGHRLAASLIAGLALGALAWLALGSGPGKEQVLGGGNERWRLPPAPSVELAAIDAVWKGRTPWGAPPAAAETAAPPQALLVGVSATGRQLQALFMMPDGTMFRLKPGDAIAGGGRVLAVSPMHVSWSDARGTKHEQELLADPLPLQVTTP